MWKKGPPSPTFNVPVDDHVAVEVGHAFQDLPGVLPGHAFRQSSVGLQLVFDGTLEEPRGQTPGPPTQAPACAPTPGMYSMKMVRVLSPWSLRQP